MNILVVASDPTAVVGLNLKVRGIESLSVIDASIMPTVTLGNTNSPTVMIAERGSALVIGEPLTPCPDSELLLLARGRQ